jgi:hypothetical protein
LWKTLIEKNTPIGLPKKTGEPMLKHKNLPFSLLLVLILLTACVNPVSLLSKTQPSPTPSETAPVVEIPTVEAAPTDLPTESPVITSTMPIEITSTVTSTLTSTTRTPALSITGKVQAQKSWSLDEIKAMPNVKANAKNAKGKAEAFSGVAIVDLLKSVVLLPEAKDVGFVSSSGKRVSYSLSFIQSCATCMLAYKTKGGFVLVVTGVAQPMAINGVVEIQIY